MTPSALSPAAPLRVEVRLRSPVDAEAYATRIDREPGFRVRPTGSPGPGDVCITDICPGNETQTPTVWLVDLPPLAGKPCGCCRRVSRGDTWASVFGALAEAAGHADSVAPPAAAPRDDLSVLTRRERDVLRLVGEGKTVSETAAILGLAESTVGNHKHRLMRKLGVKTSLALLRIAVRNGLATLD